MSSHSARAPDRRRSRLSAAAFTLFEMMGVISIFVITSGLVVGGASSAYRAQVGATAQALVGRVVDGSVRQAMASGGSGRVYGFSIRFSNSKVLDTTTGVMEQDLAIIPWYFDADPKTGALGSLKLLETIADLKNLAPIPDHVVRREGLGMTVRLSPSSSVAGFQAGAETLAWLQRREVAKPRDVTDGCFLHVCFEPVTARPHVVFNSIMSPASLPSPTFKSMFVGTGPLVGNNLNGYGSGIETLEELSRCQSYPIELVIRDLNGPQSLTNVMMVFESGFWEIRSGRG